MGRGGEAPGLIYNIIPPDSLYQPGNVTPAGVEVCPARNPWCWGPLCATGGGIDRSLSPYPVRGKEIIDH